MKKILVAAIIILIASSCVSPKLYKDLQSKYDDLKAENAALNDQLNQSGGNGEQYSVANLRAEVEKLKTENSRLAMDLAGVQSQYDRLRESYDALEANSSSVLAENFTRNRDLLIELEEKENLLRAEEARLKQLEKDLADRSARVAELEGIIASKDAKMRALKDAISAALTNFEGNGLTVEQRDGKVYVSMENKLLFDSGSWAVNSRGKEAVVALGRVLADNKEIAVLIEGHTDNVPYSSQGNISDNWDLSMKRATAIVRILTQNSGIPKDNLTAAGKGEYEPVASNSTVEGRSKNRRIEVILTPKLDEITKLLNEI